MTTTPVPLAATRSGLPSPLRSAAMSCAVPLTPAMVTFDSGAFCR